MSVTVSLVSCAGIQVSKSTDEKITWVLDPEAVEWEMQWEPRDRFPDKPAVEMVFENTGALAHLLMNGVVFLNSFWYEKTWPEEAQKCINVFVNCGDTFAYACADAERLHSDEIEGLYRMWRTDPVLGPTAWCVQKRGETPIPPIVKMLREAGYPVDSWTLHANTTDSEVQASFAAAAARLRKEES